MLPADDRNHVDADGDDQYVDGVIEN